MKTISILFLSAVSFFAGLKPAMATNFTVLIFDYGFSPSPVVIGVGDTVTWTNTSSDHHTTTSGNPDVQCGASALWNSAQMNPKGTFSVTFTNYAPGNYLYICTNHCASQGMESELIITNPPSTPPSINLTAPTNGTKVLAPANVPLQAAVTDSGTVTNVQFLSGTVPVGNVTTAPFNFTVPNLAAGNYSFSAAVMDSAGDSATSSVVSVFVLTNATLLSPRFSNGQFQLTVQGIAGQTYVTEGSSNLINWSGISTNLAPSSDFDVTAPNNSLQFYRARQDLF